VVISLVFSMRIVAMRKAVSSAAVLSRLVMLYSSP
jgi:hypothetical protein